MNNGIDLLVLPKNCEEQRKEVNYMKDYSKMVWDYDKAFPDEIVKMIYLTATNPRDMFERASESHNKDSIEYYFWTRYFGADFQNATPPEYLNEISNIDRNTRRIFSIIAFALLDKTILERLIESNINQLKGSIRIDDFDPLIIDSLILRAYSDDSFLYTGRTIAFNYEKLLSNSLFGKCLMNLLCSRLRYSLNEPQQVSFNDLLDACFELKFHKALGLSETTFKLWLKGLTGGMLWDSSEALTKSGAKLFSHTAAFPEEMFTMAHQSYDPIEYDFWEHYFGADFQNATPPEYLNEISNIDRNTRRIFSIIAFALLDKTILERLIESNINQLKGSIRIDDFDPLIIDSLILRAYSDDSFLYTGRTIAFNYEKVLSNSLFGKCLMNLLCSRLRYSLNEPQQVSFNDLLDACFELKFHKALGLSETTFKLWLKGLTGGMLWDSTEALTKSKNIAELFSHTAAFPEEMFTMAHQSYDPIEYDFWEHYFGADFSNPTPPLYLFEIRDIDREARMLFSIIAFVLLDIDILEHLIESNIKQLKGRVRIDDFNRLKSVSLFGISDSFISVNEEQGKYVEFNLEKILSIPLFGKCLMNLLNSRLRNFLVKSEVSFNELIKECVEHKFHQALGLTKTAFRQWLKGTNASVTGYYIISTSINNFICIDDATLDFNNSKAKPSKEKAKPSKEIYLLGENGDGKTLVLEALLLTYAKERIKDSSEDMGNAYKLYKTAKMEGALLKGENDKKTNYGNGCYSDLPRIFAYGTHRGRTNGRKQDFDDTGFLTLFDTNKILTDPSEWIKDFCTKGLGSIDLLSFEEYQVNNNVAQERLKELQELFDIILNKRIKIKIEKDNSVKYVEHGAELTFDQLSEGYRSTLIFICDLLYRLFDSQPENGEKAIERGRKAKAVVLIDEIDAHRHPRWQREIVGRMRELFPNVQFIMTTHSPFIIQGASDDALIFRLFRENGKTYVSEPIKRSDLDYMMINTLATSPIFGMGSARLSNDENIDYTSKSFLMERIEKLVIDKIKDEKKRTYLSEEEINKMIEDAWSQIDTNDNDKEQPL